jgi:hypothetical protein
MIPVESVVIEGVKKKDPPSEMKNVHLRLDATVDQKVDVNEAIVHLITVQDHVLDLDPQQEIITDLKVEHIVVLKDLKERQAPNQAMKDVDRHLLVQKEIIINAKVHQVIMILITQLPAIP